MEDIKATASHILLSQRPDPKEKQVISLDQDVQVCGYFWWKVDETPLYNFSLPCNVFFGMGYIFSLFFDTPCGCVAYLLWVCIFYFFLYSPYIMMITWRELNMVQHGVLFVNEWGMYLLSSRCRSIACEWTCT